MIRNISSSPRKVATANRLKRQQIPEDILSNLELNESIKLLPGNYNFEIHKTIAKIRQEGALIVALQFPEGLLLYACIIADILESFGHVKVIILGDVTYGACCIDDYTASKLNADLLIHYGHSCLVPVNITRIKVLYVFVEIAFEISNLVQTIRDNFSDLHLALALMGTIQFSAAIASVYKELKTDMPNIFVPQSKPLSAGETLGCTAPILPACDALIFIADGRFHLEAAMIHNPKVPAYRYDPYSKVLTKEGYDVEKMKLIRWNAILKARSARCFGLILGTLGRQGSNSIFTRQKRLLKKHGKIVVQFLMAEINPSKLAMITQVEVWVQVACPRLSIDWGSFFDKPVLSSYELEVSLGEVEYAETYPMDYYSSSGGTWSNYNIS